MRFYNGAVAGAGWPTGQSHSMNRTLLLVKRIALQNGSRSSWNMCRMGVVY
jgi:hypothetical protein